MRQALHIFRKDIRYLRYELFLVLALDVIFGWMSARHADTTWVELLLPLAVTYLIVRLVHAETIPGDTQFWITRPYRWSSLAGAKVLFILAFVELPLFIVQLLIVIVEGFPLAHSLPGLLWTQMLMILAVWFPIAALAAMTSGLASFVFSILALLAVGFGAQQSLFLSGMLRRWAQNGAQWPASVDWLRTTIVVVALVVIAIPVLYWQYRQRRTVASRVYAIGALVLALAAYVFTPWQLAMALQTRLSKQPSAGSSIRVAIMANPRKGMLLPFRGDYGSVYLPIAVTGVPDDVTIVADALAVTVEAADGQTFKSGVTGLSSLASSGASGKYEGIIPISRDFYKRERNQPATIRAAVYVSLFGNARSQTIPLRKQPVNVMDGLQCYVGDMFDHVYCRSAFRWPDLLVYAYGASLNPLYQLISYSPFLSGISLNDAIEAHWADTPTAATEVTIVLKEPLEHLRRDLEVRGVRLADVAVTN